MFAKFCNGVSVYLCISLPSKRCMDNPLCVCMYVYVCVCMCICMYMECIRVLVCASLYVCMFSSVDGFMV